MIHTAGTMTADEHEAQAAHGGPRPDESPNLFGEE